MRAGSTTRYRFGRIFKFRSDVRTNFVGALAGGAGQNEILTNKTKSALLLFEEDDY